MEGVFATKKRKLNLQEQSPTSMDSQNKTEQRWDNVDSSVTVVPFEAMEASGFGCLSAREADVNLDSEILKQCHSTSQKLNSFLLKSLQFSEGPLLMNHEQNALTSHESLINGSENTTMLFDWATDVSQVEVETEPQESFTNNCGICDMSWNDAPSEVTEIYLENKHFPSVKVEQNSENIAHSHNQSQQSETFCGNVEPENADTNLKERQNKDLSQTTSSTMQQASRVMALNNNEVKGHNRKTESKLKKKKRTATREGKGYREGSSTKSEKQLENRSPRGSRNIGVQSSIRSFIHRAPPARGYCGRCILRDRLPRHSVGLQCNLDDERRQRGARASSLDAVVAGEGSSSPRVRLRFPGLVRATHDARGGASVVIAMQADTGRLTRADGIALAMDFFRALLWEGNSGAVHAAGVVVGGASGAPLRVLAETVPRMRVHMLPLRPQLLPSGDANVQAPVATTVGDYFQCVRENILPGEVLRCGPLLPMSLSGGGSQCGACDGGGVGGGGEVRPAALEALAEHSPFVKVSLPGGQLNPIQHSTFTSHKRTHRSKRPRGRDAILPSPSQGDGPWLWVRPGEQLLPPPTGTETSLSSASLKRARSRIANAHLQARDDKSRCDATAVVGTEGEETEEELRKTNGWIEVVERWGPRTDSSAVAFAFVAADGSESTAAAVEAVAFAPDDLPILQSVKALANDSDSDWGSWAGSARLNYLRSRGVRWASLSLRHGDLLVIPRRAAVQLHIPTATQGISWRIRPRDYCRAPWRL